MTSLAFKPNWFHSWPPGCVTRIVTFALLALSVSIEFVFSSARVTSVKFQKGVVVSELETPGPMSLAIDRTPCTHGAYDK